MSKRFKLGFWIIGFGWFPMMFVNIHPVIHDMLGFWLIVATFLICATGMFFVLSMPIDDIFKSSETLRAQIKKYVDAKLDYLRWIEAVKRISVKKAGLAFKDIEKAHDKLVEKNWTK